jgi:hypothetical protein
MFRENPSFVQALRHENKKRAEGARIQEYPGDKSDFAQPSILAPFLNILPKVVSNACIKRSFLARARPPPIGKVHRRPLNRPSDSVLDTTTRHAATPPRRPVPR